MTTTGPKLVKSRRRTGEKPERRQPLKIDKLPDYVREDILKRRAEGKTWLQLEEESRQFVPWESLAPMLAAEFPGRRLPHSSLQRWYDLRVEQVRKEVMAEGEQARVFAEKLAAAGMENVDDALVNAFRDEVFRLTQTADPKSRAAYRAMLNQFSLVLTRVERMRLQRTRTEMEVAKLDAERARTAAEAGDPREIYLLASQDVLKKLRTRTALRDVIDPIRDELIQELAHGAESFAKQVKASTAQ